MTSQGEIKVPNSEETLDHGEHLCEDKDGANGHRYLGHSLVKFIHFPAGLSSQIESLRLMKDLWHERI